MQDAVIRPTMKYIKAGYVVVAVLILAALVGASMLQPSPYRPWAFGLPFLLLLWPVQRHIQRQFTRATISGDRLRYEFGMMSKTTRNISLPKVQDARVDQSLMQRMFGVGNLSIETAGEASRLTLLNVDNPQKVADEILAASHSAGSTAP
jgi:uncharacterized membrane protein YdbT with pleckstrin-like domain